MKYEEIYELISGLSRSQGFYGRLLRELDNLDEDSLNEVKAEWESKNFKDSIEFILFLEQ